MELRLLGNGGPQVSAFGLGCMGMSGLYGPAGRRRPSDLRPPDRILPDLPRHRGIHLADGARVGYRHHSLWGVVPRTHQRALDEGGGGGGGFPLPQSPVRGRERRPQSRAGRCASGRGASVAQIAIAWVAAQGSDIIPLLGARRCDHLAEALGAGAVRLRSEDLAAIERAVPKGAAAGERYAPAQMASLDSERG